MSGYTIEVKSDIPALVATWHEDFKYTENGLAYATEVNAKLSEQKNPVFYIMDFSAYKEMSMNELLEASSRAARTKGSNFHNPMTRAVIMVTTNDFMALAAEGFKSAVFGNVDMHTFTSLDDALKFVRENANKPVTAPKAEETPKAEAAPKAAVTPKPATLPKPTLGTRPAPTLKGGLPNKTVPAIKPKTIGKINTPDKNNKKP